MTTFELDYAAVGLAVVLALAFMAVTLTAASQVAPRRRDQLKAIIYECGIPPVGERWAQVRIRYYVFAILFLIFDVEAVFLYPWAVAFRGLGPAAFWSMMLFIAILLFGLAYAWRKGALKWK